MAIVRFVLAALLCTVCSARRDDEVARTLEAAQTAARRGELAEALTLVDARLARIPADDSSPTSWKLRLLRGELLVMRRDLDTAGTVVLAPVPNTTELAAVRARQRYLQARVSLERGDLDEAQRLATDTRSDPGIDDETILDVDLLVGRIHLVKGQFAEAESAMRSVLDSSVDRYRLLQALNNLGNGRLRRRRYDEALVWLERALKLSDFEQTSLYATAMGNAGICYSRLGLFDRALDIQKRAVQIQRSKGGSKALVEALGSLGNTFVLSRRAEDAVPYLREAFESAAQAKLTEDAELWAGNLAAAHSVLGNWDEAEQLNAKSRAFAASGSRLKPAYNTLNDAEVAFGRRDFPRARQLYGEALSDADGAPDVIWSAEDGLAKVAFAQGAHDTAARHYERALATVERTRSGLLSTDYRLSFLTQLIDFYRGYVDALVDQQRSDRALEIADSSRGRVLAERQRVDAPARVTAATFQRVAARTKTTLLSYWLAPKRSFLWVITGTGVRRVDLPPAVEIEGLVREHRALVDNSLANPIDKAGTAGDRLYEMLVGPAKIPRNTSVVIVPDGALHGINFETLPVDGPTRHYWIEDVQIQVAPSLAMLTSDTGKTSPSGQLLLIGNPTPRAPDFPALSYAPTEMTGIVRHFPQERVTSRDTGQATPAAYLEAPLEQFSMIHFTAHAVANVESPLDSAVVLSGPDTAYKLYARDVADRPLKADLVTVSACRSAGERAYSGEGLVGFAWAFLRAGAHRVVAGLWDVDDRSTAQLMGRLYGGVAGGQAPAAALRAAKLELIKQGGQLARPYYWGPFQLFTVTP